MMKATDRETAIWDSAGLTELAKRLSAEPGAERLNRTLRGERDESREKETKGAGKGTVL